MLQREFSGFQIGNNPGDGAFVVADGGIICCRQRVRAGVGYGDAHLRGVEHGYVVVVIADGNGLADVQTQLTHKIADGRTFSDAFGQDLEEGLLGTDEVKVDRYSARKMTVKTASPLWLHTDGEVFAKTNSVTLTCEKEKLQVLM